jgi:hypothetical protein
MDAEELEIEQKKIRIEKWKTFFSILTPLILVYLTFIVQSTLTEKEAEFERLQQILNEKQRIYGTLGSDLNRIYVYIADVGDFRQYTPLQIIQKKRECDRLFFTYLPYWSEETASRYTDFMKSAFATYQGAGERAKIKAMVHEKRKAYEKDNLNWEESWDDHFTERRDPNYDSAYWRLVESLLADTVSSKVRQISL